MDKALHDVMNYALVPIDCLRMVSWISRFSWNAVIQTAKTPTYRSTDTNMADDANQSVTILI